MKIELKAKIYLDLFIISSCVFFGYFFMFKTTDIVMILRMSSANLLSLISSQMPSAPLSTEIINPYLIMLIALVAVAFASVTAFKTTTVKSSVIIFSAAFVIFAVSIVLFQFGIVIDYFSIICPMVVSYILSSYSLTSFLQHISVLQEKIEQLNDANRKIIEAQQEIVKREQLSTIGKMTAKVLHEIKGPLANIKNFLYMVKEGMLNKEESENMTKLACQETDRLIELSQQLREAYTPHIKDKSAININNLIAEALEMSRPRFLEKSIEIKSDLSQNLPAIAVSPSKIKQVFLNIINNAHDAMSLGGTLTVKTLNTLDVGRGTIGVERPTVCITFTDTGCGIPKENIPNLFDAFYTTKDTTQGSGLGLFICNEIVKAHCGEIKIDSTCGKGTTVTIALPI